MSNYIQALKRLERDGHIEVPMPAREPVRRAERVARERNEPLAGRDAGDLAATRVLPSAVGGLLERLRTLSAPTAGARVLVFAPATPSRAARVVVDGLAARARDLALPVGVGELTRAGAHATLGDRSPARPTEPARAPRPIELDGPNAAAGLRAWLDHDGATQLVLIEAPAILASADALLLAAACDGLVLVAETGITDREALGAAAARARAAGCPLLGVVLTGA